jgi:hypothetical protein
MAIRVRIHRRVPRARQRRFTLTAVPRLKPDGPTRGFLDYVVFTARAPGTLHMWHADRSANLIADFSTLVPRQTATHIVRRLHLGHAILLPGRYRIDQFEAHFNFPGLASETDDVSEREDQQTES